MYKRDFSAPTLEDHFNKTILPKVMQVSLVPAPGAASSSTPPVTIIIIVTARLSSSSPPGQKLWSVWTHQVHPPGGPGHHVVRLRLGPGERPEQQVLQAEGSRREGRVRAAHGEEEEGLSWEEQTDSISPSFRDCIRRRRSLLRLLGAAPTTGNVQVHNWDILSGYYCVEGKECLSEGAVQLPESFVLYFFFPM